MPAEYITAKANTHSDLPNDLFFFEAIKNIPTATESNPENNGNSPSDDTVVDVKTDVKREIDWKITGIIIGADVLVVGGVIAVLILLYKKKVRELIIK